MSAADHLKSLRERVEAATEGPWGVLSAGNHRAGAVAAQEGVIADTESPSQQDDAEFIAHARTDLPRLLDAVEKVLELHYAVHWRDLHDTCHEDGCRYPCPTVAAINDALEGK